MLFFSAALGAMLTTLMGRRLVKNISYIPEKNKLEVVQFSALGFNKTRIYEPY